MSDRFLRPSPGDPSPVRFPEVTRTTLDTGLGLWVVPFDGVPIGSVALVIAHGTAADPEHLPGLASFTGDLVDEGAGARDAIGVAEAFGRLGTELDVDVGPDSTVLSFSSLSGVLGDALQLLAEIVSQPRLAEPDFERLRDLRLGRLRQISRSAAAVADRAFINAVLAGHPYGHGSLGTTSALRSMTVDDVRRFWTQAYQPARATLIVSAVGAASDVQRAADRAFRGWQAGTADALESALSHEVPAAPPRVIVVDRPGAPQSEVRIGHVAPGRRTPLYHALVVLNAIVGGQYTSRINRRLREEKGVTYGARSSFDFRRAAGTFSCDASVQADATAESAADVLEELAAIRRAAVSDAELAAAKSSLTRGYVRHFETAGQLTRAASQLVTLDLPVDTFDGFVPAVDAVDAALVQTAATSVLDPGAATVVVVGDADACQSSLTRLGREVVVAAPEF